MNMNQAIDYLNQQKLKRYPTFEKWIDAMAMNDIQRHNIVDVYTAFLSGELLYQKQKWYVDWKKPEKHNG